MQLLKCTTKIVARIFGKLHLWRTSATLLPGSASVHHADDMKHDTGLCQSQGLLVLWIDA